MPSDQASIQDGLNAASFGDTVLVAPGTYFENITWPNVNGIKLITEGDTSDTFIDGSESGRVIHIQGHEIDTLTLIEGFTIQHGRGIGSISGSGVLCDSSSVSLDRCRIRKCKGKIGCGIAFRNSFSTITNSTISSNIGSGNQVGGVGMFVDDYSIIQINSSQIVDNLADTCYKVLGAGIYLSKHSEVRFRDSEVSRNTGITRFNYSESRGVGIFSHFSSKVNMLNCSISENRAYGPAEFVLGVAINSEEGTETTLEACEIVGNVCESSSNAMTGILTIIGGVCSVSDVELSNNTLTLLQSSDLSAGILYVFGNLNAENLIVRNNVVTSSTVDAILDLSFIRFNGYHLNSNLSMSNSLIANNNSHNFQIDQSTSGLIKLSSAESAMIINSTIADNLVQSGQPIGLTTLMADTSSIQIVNSIFHNSNLQSAISGTEVSVSYSNIRGGHSGTGNIDADPMFIGNGDYRLQTFSPCINSGTTVGAPLTDIEGNPRPMPVGTNPDMGAYEDDNPSTSIRETTDSENLSIYPNPTNGFVQISLKEKVESVQVFSPIGTLVAEFTQNEKNIDLNGLSNGVYSLVVTSEKRKLTEKLVLTK